ncbi:MAG: DUF2721 domain-containing protein [Chloroflexi bacterium]|nr:DUF2721 domain-containing protein [Chloroflexota bacterium]
MNAEMVGWIIQLILAPALMVSACAITQGGLLGRYAAINDRPRAMGRERLDLLRDKGEAESGNPTAISFTAERFQQIDHQIPDLLHRHKITHDAVLAVYCAILFFVGDMFTIAMAVVTNLEGVAIAALVIFLVSTAVLLVGMYLAVIEIHTSHRALHYEVQQIVSLHR